MENILELLDPPGLRPSRPGMRLLARLRGASLDASLAAGAAPESSPLLAARAQVIVTPRARRQIAASYQTLLRAAHRTGSYPDRRYPVVSARTVARAVPVCADRVLAAEPAIHGLTGRLTLAAPLPARGVAMARVLLTDGTSPVYLWRSRVSLTAALEEATAQLDPALPLLPR